MQNTPPLQMKKFYSDFGRFVNHYDDKTEEIRSELNKVSSNSTAGGETEKQKKVRLAREALAAAEASEG